MDNRPMFAKPPPLSRLRLAIVCPGESEVAKRAIAISQAAGLPLDGYAVLDSVTVGHAVSSHLVKQEVQAALSQAIANVSALADTLRTKLNVISVEGDPEKVIPNTGADHELLVLPHYGYFHHGVDLRTPDRPGRPDGLLRLAGLHCGPTLLTNGLRERDPVETRIAVFDDGTAKFPEKLASIVAMGIWPNPRLFLASRHAAERSTLFRAAIVSAGVEAQIERLEGMGNGILTLPDDYGGFAAVVVTELPRPLRTVWYGRAWLDHFGPSWSGEVLVAPTAF